MSILIKGMEMPKSCNLCPFEFSGDCLLNRDIICTCEPVTRSSDCPLVPVPPHGRLIDADAEIERVQKLYDNAVERDPDMGCVNVYEGEIAVLKLAPTIIPAEEGET